MDKVKAIELVETVENAVTAYNDFAKANELETMTYN